MFSRLYVFSVVNMYSTPFRGVPYYDTINALVLSVARHYLQSRDKAVKANFSVKGVKANETLRLRAFSGVLSHFLSVGGKLCFVRVILLQRGNKPP